MMLRDYLSKEMSSCSSSGFQSFTRQRCCSVVRLLADSHNPKFPPFSSPHKEPPSSSFLKTTLHLLPRCLSRKLIRRLTHRKKPVENGQVVIRLQAYFQMDPLTPSDSEFHLPESSSGDFDSPESIQQRNDAEDSPVSSIAVAERWTKGEKEHNSPVSVLDYNEKELSPKNPKGKIKKYDKFTDLDPVDLLDRYIENDSKSSSLQYANWGFVDSNRSLLLDDDETQRRTDRVDDWLNGKPDDVALGWHSEQGRVTYLRDIEKHDNAIKLKENEKVAFEIEEEAFNSLLEEELKLMLQLGVNFYKYL